MAEIVYKAKKPFKQDGKHYYPITTHDQIIMPDGNRWDGQHLSSDTRDEAVEVGSIKVNADLLNGKLPEYYKDANTLGGKLPEYYIQPKNLLDNSDFRNPVNQRGFVSGRSVESYAYFIDRWINGEESSIIPDLSNNGINPNGAIYQRLDNLSAYIGKSMTFAIGLSSGNIIVASGTLTDVTDNDMTIFNTTDGSNEIAIGSNTNMWYAWINYPNSTIKWAALYEGSYTANTLPPYIPKGYTAELAECQRYFWLCDNSYFSEGSGYAFSSTECRFMISTPQTMRISPSIRADNNNTTSYGIKLIINGKVLTPKTVSVRRANNRLCLTLGGNFTTNTVGVMRIESQLSFSADL